MKVLLLLIIICIPGALTQAQNKLSTKDVEAIKQIEETYRDAWLKNDEVGILSLFTNDATIYPSGFTPAKGKDGMRKFWFAPSDSITTIHRYELKINEVFGERKLAIVIGENILEWSMEKKDKTSLKRFLSNGYFTAIYVKTNKSWKILKRHWSNKTEEIK